VPGYRFRLHRKDLPGKPDLAFPARRKVIFVHGCFWHQHPDAPRAVYRTHAATIGRRKLARNQQRDAMAQAALTDQGWQFAVAWECELKNIGTVMNTATQFLRPVWTHPVSQRSGK
jgi:DNA mismatch endonuclease (patch repair protein)